jgi:predicted phosphodiesterase
MAFKNRSPDGNKSNHQGAVHDLSPMNVLLLSDLHLENPGFVPYPNIDDIPENVDVVVLAGDIHVGTQGVAWAQKYFSRWPVLYVPGNHEFYGGEYHETLTNLRHACAGSNVQLLERDSVVIGDIGFLGTTLWTDFLLFADTEDEDGHKEQAWAMADAASYMADFGGSITVRESPGVQPVQLTPAHTVTWHKQSVLWLEAMLGTPFEGKTIVISHHAPCQRSVPPEFTRHRLTPAYASRLDCIVEKSDYWLHGHTHHELEYKQGRCCVIVKFSSDATFRAVAIDDDVANASSSSLQV